MADMQSRTLSETSNDLYALSPMQQGMLFHHLLEPNSGADIEQMLLFFHEEVDSRRMTRAWHEAARRHEVLRTSFVWDRVAEPMQRVDATSPMEIVEAVIDINEATKRRMIDKVMELCDDTVNGKKIAVLGVTFKPNTDDMRDSPSLTIVPALVGAGANVHVVDPQGLKEGEALLPGVTWQDDPYKAIRNAEAVVLLTEWNEFRALDLERVVKVMKDPRMADLRNVYDPKDAEEAGLKYVSVGR